MTLQDYWKDYRDKLYPKGIPANQNQELHQAFMAGALVALTEMDAASKCEDTPKAELAAVENLDSLLKEVQAWSRERVADLMHRKQQRKAQEN